MVRRPNTMWHIYYEPSIILSALHSQQPCEVGGLLFPFYILGTIDQKG